MDIILLEPEYYKPGFPVNYKVALKSIRGERLADTNVRIELKQNDKVFYANDFVSDSNGYVSFELDCGDPDQADNCAFNSSQKYSYSKSPSIISLKVVPAVVDQAIKNTNSERLNNALRIFSIYPWLSAKHSYIQLDNRMSQEEVKCGNEMNIKVKISSASDLNDKNVYFQLQARSEIINAGYYSFVSGQTISSQDEYKLQLVSANKKLLDYKSNDTVLDQRCLQLGKGLTEKETTTKSKNAYDPWSFSRSVWFLNSKTNECEERNLYEHVNDYFYSKHDCEDKCLDSAISYNQAGVPHISEDSKLKELFEYTLEFKFNVTSEMSPDVKLLTYIVIDDEIIPDSILIKTQRCLRNNVEFSVDQTDLQVGQKIQFQIATSPKSLCALSAIDKSVSLMGKRNSVNLDRIFTKLEDFALSYDSENEYETISDKDCKSNSYLPLKRARTSSLRRPSRSIYRPFNSKFYDSSKAFRISKVIYLSDLKIFKECKYNRYYESNRMGFAMPRANFRTISASVPLNSVAEDESENYPLRKTTVEFSSLDISSSSLNNPLLKKTIRTDFPETWLFQLDMSNEKGLIVKKTTVPDTITEWILDTYCLSKDTGFGIGKTQNVRVFQPLFVSVDLPYSVIRGETFPVKASVFNYENTCVPILVEILYEKKFTLDGKNSVKSVEKCICEEEKITQVFNLKALDFDNEKGFKISTRVSSLNSTQMCDDKNKTVTKTVRFIDLEAKNVLVEPEGIPKEEVHSLFAVFRTNQKIVDQSFEIKLPENIVPKSARAYLSLTGDALGPILSNLNKLVQQPTGCGEQNMVKFAPIISVTDYLKGTNQLTDQMNALTKEYLKIGYQRQLTYRHEDGSFRAFGGGKGSTGGTWITAYVLRCFSETFDSQQIKIDENDILLSLSSLLTRQQKDGSFTHTGAQLFSKALSGGLKEDKTGLSAYVMICLIKALKVVNPKTEENQRIKLGLDFLGSSLDSIQNVNTYSLALILYCFKLTNSHTEYVSIIEHELDTRSISQNGFLYWSDKTNSSDSSTKSSADLEITAYILLAKLQNLQPEEINKVIQMAKWINSQRNSLGGFYSTQDTVIALSALSKFATSFYVKKNKHESKLRR